MIILLSVIRQVRKDYKSALYNLALILAEEKRFFEAEIYLNQLLKYHPKHAKGLLLLGDVFSSFDQLDRAEEVIREYDLRHN